jgi:hypothetical protein
MGGERYPAGLITRARGLGARFAARLFIDVAGIDISYNLFLIFNYRAKRAFR